MHEELNKARAEVERLKRDNIVAANLGLFLTDELDEARAMCEKLADAINDFSTAPAGTGFVFLEQALAAYKEWKSE